MPHSVIEKPTERSVAAYDVEALRRSERTPSQRRAPWRARGRRLTSRPDGPFGETANQARHLKPT